MYNFFVTDDQRQGQGFLITGADFNHIKNVLRMKNGDTLLVSNNNASHLCEITINDDYIFARITEENYQDTALPVKLHLFQGLPKGDKMELIIQKAVELGVEEITPVEMNRCVVKIEEKKRKSKQARWQAIAEGAAKQSKRTAVPLVNDIMSFKQFLQKSGELDLLLVPYENKDGMKATAEALSLMKKGSSVGILIGPEGGFDEKEIASAIEAGGKSISLGRRILRTETAAITAMGMCMLYAEMNIGEEV